MQTLRLLLHRKHLIFSAFLMMVILMLGTVFALVLASSWLSSRTGIINSPAKQYDFIIVGAGTAGCILASHLVRDATKPSVLLIEAGDNFPWWSSVPMAAPLLQGTSNDWRYYTVPQKHSSWGLNNKTSSWPRGRGMGGSGQLNYMVHFPGIESDFKTWEEMGVEGWKYKDIQSAIIKILESVREHKVSSINTACTNNYKSVLTSAARNYCEKKALKRLSGNFNNLKLHVSLPGPKMSSLVSAFLKGGEHLKKEGHSSLLFTPAYNTIKDGHRWSTFDGFLRPVLSNKNLHILLKTVVSKILFSGKRKAVGVEVIKSTNETHHVYSKKETILCAGSINTPQILLLSGIGPKQHLMKMGIPLIKDLPVGLNLYDHLNFPLYVSIERPVSISTSKVLKLSEIIQYITAGEGYLASSGILGVGTASPDLGIVLFGVGSINEHMLRQIANYKISTFKSLFPFSQNSSQEGFVLLASCLQPISRGFVSLQSLSPMQPPLIDPQYLSQREDVICMSKAINLAVKLVRTQPFQELKARLHLPVFHECKHIQSNIKNNEYLECILRTAAITGYHPGGTCKMGKRKDGTAVVDSFLRVHGITGIRVVDASVLPTPLSGHPNTIISAIGERAASLILSSLEN